MLPCPVGPDGAFWRFYWWDPQPGVSWTTDPVFPARGLDPVERLLAVTGARWNGLPVAARALAAWARISAGHDRLLSAHAPDSLAAAINRLVAHRAGGRATFAEAAEWFRVPEPDVRRADRPVRTSLALGPDRAW